MVHRWGASVGTRGAAGVRFRGSDADGLLVLLVPRDHESEAPAVLDIAPFVLQMPLEIVSAVAAEAVDGSLPGTPIGVRAGERCGPRASSRRWSPQGRVHRIDARAANPP